MNYRGKKIAITGVKGFIGTALYDQLIRYVEDPNGNDRSVYILDGDIRNPETFERLDASFDYLFHFAAPSSQVQFQRMPNYCMETTVKGFMNAADACRKFGIRLVYPSTGLLSSDKYNEYALCKKFCEQYASGGNLDSIGLRIFAAYGPGEGHKRDYASVPYLFAKDMVHAQRPVVFGDGSQVRDFIYIDDVINAILILAEECPDKIIDIGSGQQVSFNQLITQINGHLSIRSLEPIYVPSPAGYVGETMADISRMRDFLVPSIDLYQGINYLVKNLQELE